MSDHNMRPGKHIDTDDATRHGHMHAGCRLYMTMPLAEHKTSWCTCILENIAKPKTHNIKTPILQNTISCRVYSKMIDSTARLIVNFLIHTSLREYKINSSH